MGNRACRGSVEAGTAQVRRMRNSFPKVAYRWRDPLHALWFDRESEGLEPRPCA
jgi:hypothetical protein